MTSWLEEFYEKHGNKMKPDERCKMREKLNEYRTLAIVLSESAGASQAALSEQNRELVNRLEASELQRERMQARLDDLEEGGVWTVDPEEARGVAIEPRRGEGLLLGRVEVTYGVDH